MAISTATLTVTVTESLKLNGVTYGNTTTKSIGNCGESIQKAISVDHDSSKTLLSFSSATERDNFVYFRVKNCSTSNFITLTIGGAVTGAHKVKLLAGESYETTCNEIWDFTANAWDKINRIDVQSDTTASDVEFLYVSK